MIVKKYNSDAFLTKPLFISFSLFLISSCQQSGKSNFKDSQTELTDESALSFMMSMIAGTFDELSTPISMQCGKVNGQQCQSGTGNNTFQQIEYKKSSCNKGSDQITGTVRLDSNRADCKLPQLQSDYLVLSQELIHTNPSDFTTTTYSSLRRTSGYSIGVGGGITLTYVNTFNSGYLLNVNGVHRTLYDSRKSSTVSDRTLVSVSPIKIATTDFSQNARTIPSGSLMSTNNLLGEKILFTFKNVAWKKLGCCFPTEGSIESINTTAPNADKSTITFFSNNCGAYSETFSDGKAILGTLTQCGGNVN